MKKIKINNGIIIAKIKGQNKLILCGGDLVFKEVYDLITMEEHKLLDGDIEKYLSFGYFKSLKGFMGKDIDEKMLVALDKYIQTDKFKDEFKNTYKELHNWVRELGSGLDKCDELYN